MAVLMGIFGAAGAGALRYRRLRRHGLHGLRADPRYRTPHGAGRAARRSVLRMVFRRGMITTLPGSPSDCRWPGALGTPHVVADLRRDRQRSRDVHRHPAGILLAAAAVAIYVPARRAMQDRPDHRAALRVTGARHGRLRCPGGFDRSLRPTYLRKIRSGQAKALAPPM